VLNTAHEATDDTDTYSTNEDSALTVAAPGVLGNDTDAEGDSLTVADGDPSDTDGSGEVDPVSGPSNGTLTLRADGSFTYTPNANYNGPDSFTYKATDGKAESNTATVSITVNPVNDAPTIEVAAGGSCASASGTMNLTVGDLETAAGDLTLGKSSSNRTLVPNANIAFGGGGANRTVTITPAANKSGKATITLTVRDGNGGTASTTITVVVGTNNRETIFGTSASDMIFGKNGNDTINADNGNDLLCGGDGNDRLRGENGDDTLHGGQDEDTLEGGSGNDRLRGGEDEDTLSGSLGADFFSGGADTDTATDFNAAEGDTKDNTTP
jgi:VCBS repeat-containing protein